jgi:hypothetical protein
MDTIELYRAEADDCLRRADVDSNQDDKPLWITLAQSWLQLAEEADNVRTARLERAVHDALV